MVGWWKRKVGGERGRARKGGLPTSMGRLEVISVSHWLSVTMA